MVTTTRLMTAEELWALPDDERRYDLIRGVLHAMSPAQAEHGELGMEFGRRVGNHVFDHGLGKVYSSETGFILARDPDTVLAPDVAFVRGDRLPTPRSARRKFLPLAPDLVVEVVSPSNSATDIEDKVQDYLDGGVRLVVLVYPIPRTVVLHRPGHAPQRFQEGDELDLGDVLPGFRLALADLFRE